MSADQWILQLPHVWVAVAEDDAGCVLMRSSVGLEETLAHLSTTGRV